MTPHLNPLDKSIQMRVTTYGFDERVTTYGFDEKYEKIIIKHFLSRALEYNTCCIVVLLRGGRFNSNNSLCLSSSSALSISAFGMILSHSLPGNYQGIIVKIFDLQLKM